MAAKAAKASKSVAVKDAWQALAESRAKQLRPLSELAVTFKEPAWSGNCILGESAWIGNRAVVLSRGDINEKNIKKLLATVQPASLRLVKPLVDSWIQHILPPLLAARPAEPLGVLHIDDVRHEEGQGSYRFYTFDGESIRVCCAERVALAVKVTGADSFAMSDNALVLRKDGRLVGFIAFLDFNNSDLKHDIDVPAALAHAKSGWKKETA